MQEFRELLGDAYEENWAATVKEIDLDNNQQVDKDEFRIIFKKLMGIKN